MKTHGIFILFILSILSSCNYKPVIPISDTLKIGLADRYSNYVTLLNKSAASDSIALSEFLQIDYIDDGAGYDHGWVIIQLLKKVGDFKFSNAIAKMNKQQINNLKNYFEVGLDANDNKANKRLYKQYPLTFQFLEFE